MILFSIYVKPDFLFENWKKKVSFHIWPHFASKLSSHLSFFILSSFQSPSEQSNREVKPWYAVDLSLRSLFFPLGPLWTQRALF